jgi:hypothetical protein
VPRGVKDVRRRVVVHEDDVLIVGGLELDAAVLRAIVDPDRRLLWTFIRGDDDGSIQPLALSEDKVLWLTPSDLERKEPLGGV